MNSTSARPMGDTTKALVTAACVLLGGCAAMSESECRSADWYHLGERDALSYGLRPQLDLYAYQCSRFNVQPSDKDYLAGWVDGYREWNTRVSGSECCGAR